MRPQADFRSGVVTSVRYFQILFFGLLAICLVHWGAGLEQPLVDAHEFRQTQTALGAQHFDWNNPWHSFFQGELPVLGSPWKVPFEFPLFQSLVSATVGGLGVPMDVAGRGISLLCFVLTFFPIYCVLKRVVLSHEWAWAGLSMVLVSPLYLYWSRAFLIESMAVLFAMSFVAVSLRASVSKHCGLWLLAATFATLAGLVKITTLPAFAFLALALGMWQSGSRDTRTQLRLLLPMGTCLAVAVGVSLLWTHHADAIKAAHPVTAHLVSSNLRAWNFGYLSERISGQFWLDIVVGNMANVALGTNFHLVIILLGTLLGAARQAWAIAILFAAWLLAPLIFSNLYIHHTYYSYANGLLLIMATALAAESVCARTNRPTAGYIYVAIFSGICLAA